MSNGPPLYNSRLTKMYVEYLRLHHPQVDVESVLEALVPGVKAEELSIQAEGNTVKISGELIAPALSADEKVQTLRSEIGFGKFSRAFEMPEEIDADKIDANLDNGVLTVHVPKAEAVKPRSIKVQAK